MNSTITQNKFLKNLFKTVIVAAFWILLWEAASRLVSRENELLLLILPSPVTVFKTWLNIAFTKPFINATLLTLVRIFTGFISGAVFGFLLGVLTHLYKPLYSLFSPILKIIRAVPVVAIIILMYLFFKSEILPIFIVFLMVLPLIWQTVFDGLENTDIKLLEMAKVYKLSPIKTLLKIRLAYIMPSLISSAVNGLGLAWKSGVAAEVICLPTVSLGTMLWVGKGNVNFDEVYAVTLTVVLLSLIIEYLLKFFSNKFLLRGGAFNDKA